MAELSLNQITKRYGQLAAVSNMTWTVRQGEFVVLFGPSGAGKTTTLKLIAGLEPFDEGDLTFNGQSMREVDTADRNVAMAFENYALYPHLTVYENVAFPMMIPGRQNITKDQIKQRVAEIAAVLQISELLDRKPQNLSGGQRQRVALGRCLVREPEVCLLDEPIAHLDAKLRHRMYAELKRLQRERGTTTVYATPAQSEAMAMADRIVILFEGKVQQVATPRELYESPATVAVAKFGGEQPMNIVPIELSQEDGQLYFSLDTHRVEAPDNLQRLWSSNTFKTDVLLGVRPPDIDLRVEAGPASVPAELYAIEQLGRTARVTARIKDQFIEIAAKTDVEARIGDTIWLSLADSPLYIFDAETTELVAAAGLGSDGEKRDFFGNGNGNGNGQH